MDRKKTILIAVMVNAGLLVVLFVAALSSQDEEAPSEIARTSLGVSPLFPTEADAVLQHVPSVATSPSIPFKPPVQEIVVEALPVEAPVHKLPPPLPEPVATLAPARHEGIEVTVKKGDSLEKIAKAHHTTVDEMIRINGLPGSFLRIGQVLKIPEPKTAAPVVKKAPNPEMAPSHASAEYYTVKVGDNPWGIAMKHHMKIEELLKLNHLNEEKARKLKPGDRLRIK